MANLAINGASGRNGAFELNMFVAVMGNDPAGGTIMVGTSSGRYLSARSTGISMGAKGLLTCSFDGFLDGALHVSGELTVSEGVSVASEATDPWMSNPQIGLVVRDALSKVEYINAPAGGKVGASPLYVLMQP